MVSLARSYPSVDLQLYCRSTDGRDCVIMIWPDSPHFYY